MTDPHPWWRGAVVYQLYIRSFADGDGDGIGDIAGMRSRLPYLRDLGVDAVWVNPWFPSPMVDGGYLGFRGEGMAWLPAPERVLRFDRPGGLEVVVNLGHTPIELPTGRPVLLASDTLPEHGRLPPDTAVWLG